MAFLVPQATPYKAFMGFRCLVRDQEVDGSNPFAPTNSFKLEPVIYRETLRAADRLVSGQEVHGSNRIAPTTLFPVLS